MMAVFWIALTSALAAEPVSTAEAGWAVTDFRESTGLPSDGTYMVAEDDLGRLVVGTAQGLMVGDGQTWRLLRASEPGGPPDNRPFYVLPADGGGVWVVTESGGVQRRRGDVVQDFGRLGQPEIAVRPVWGSSPPLFTTYNGVYELGDPVRLRDELPARAGEAVQDADGLVWWTEDGDYGRTDLVTGQSERTTAAENDRVAHQVIGAATHAAGFDINNDGIRHDQTVVAQLSGDWFGLASDGTELWAAPKGGLGLVRIRPTPLTLHRPPAGVPDPNVAQVIADNGDVWALSQQAGTVWSVEGQQACLNMSNAHPVTLDDRTWWVGIHGVTPQLGECSDPRQDPSVLAAIAPSSVGVHLPSGGWRSGCAVYEPVYGWRQASYCNESPLHAARAAVSLPDGSVIIGGLGGLALQTSWNAAPTPLPLPEAANPRHLRIDGDRLWMATERYGLCAIRIAAVATGDWRCVGPMQGLPDVLIHATARDSLGRVWASTDRGLIVMNADELEAVVDERADDIGTWTLGTGWGIPDAEFNGYLGNGVAETADGRLWFAHVDGVVEVRPDRLPVPHQLSVTVAGIPTHPLPVDHAPVRLDLIVQPRIAADAVRLRMRRNGGQWVDVGTTLTLPALAAGTHTVQIQARLLGDWQSGPTVTLRRTPTFTETASFYALIGLLVVGLFALALMLRNRRLQRRSAELTSQVEAQTARLVAQNETLAGQANTLHQQNQTLAGQAETLNRQNETILAQVQRLSVLDEVKRRFIADITHELRTPLTLVLGALEASETEADVALKNARRLHTLVDELFDLSRLEGGKLQLRARHLSLDALVLQVSADFEPAFTAQQRPLTLQTESIKVWADAGLIQKILNNLIANALTHGRGAVSVTVRSTDEQAIITVQDEGPGIPKDEREHVFERFVQLSVGDTRASEGAGIGLALVREFAELHAGSAEVHDNACFIVRFPLGNAHLRIDDIDMRALVSESTEPVEPAAPPPVLSSDAPDILVVEDSDDMRAWLVQLLSERWSVAFAANGSEGLAAAIQTPPRLIVTDVRMPVMDGFGMTHALREAGVLTPVLFVSAKALPEDIERGRRVGDGYLTKPFGAQALIAEVDRLMPTPPQTEPEHIMLWREQLDAAADAGIPDPAFGVAELARATSISIRGLQLKMKAIGLPSPATWLRERRLQTGRDLLQRSVYETVGEVAAAVGMSRSYFSRAYRAWAGVSPGSENGG